MRSSESKNTKVVICPRCHKAMTLKNTDTSFDTSRGKPYQRKIYWCRKDDIWTQTEIPTEITKQITVFSGVLIKNEKVLLVKRNEKELPDAHLKWEFPGGKCDVDETPREALVREFMEETGIKVKATSLLPNVWTNYWRYDSHTQQTLCFLFVCEYVSESKRKADHHVKKVAWIPLADVNKLDSLPGTAEITKLALAQHQLPMR